MSGSHPRTGHTQVHTTMALKSTFAVIWMCITACTSVPAPTNHAAAPDQKPEAPVLAPVAERAAMEHTKASPAPLPPPQPQPQQLGLMQIEINALKEKMSSLQRKIELIMKAQRSGLFEPDNLEQIRSAVSKAESKKSSIAPLESAGPLDAFEHDFDSRKLDQPLTPENPKKIVDTAVNDLAQGEYARVAQALEGFQNRFPNSPLSNTAELTLAEAYVELKSPQQALPHIRTFYLQHPNDTLIYRAKWLEARVQEQLEAPQKASQLYREVIALSPQSDLALRSRAALENITRSIPQ